MLTGGVVAGCGRRKAKVVGGLLWWLGCGGEGSGGLVELFGDVVGGGHLVVGVMFGPK